MTETKRVWIRTPYSILRNLGKSYNEEMALIPDSDSACFIDGDLSFCTPDFGTILHDYANKYPDSVLTCWTNRIHQLATGQLHPTCNGSDMAKCIEFALSIREDRSVSELTGPVSGFLMVVPKSVWLKHKFTEVNVYKPDEPNLLGVDNSFTNGIRKMGIKVLRMNGLFCWHSYRLLDGSKKHLL